MATARVVWSQEGTIELPDDLPGVDEQARTQANAATDAAVAADQRAAGVGAELAELTPRVEALEAQPDDDHDDELRAAVEALIARVSAIETQPPPVPEVTQDELDALAALVASVSAEASADIVALSDLVNSLEDADQAEDDAQTAQLVELANRIGSGPAALNPDNDILLDAFTGSDDARLTAALTVAAASNPRRAIRLSARAHTFTQSRTTFSGLRILGPAVGWQNPEIGGTGGALPQCVANLNIALSGFWLVGTSTTYDVVVAGITFKSSNGSGFYQHPFSAGTSYATHLADLTWYGFRYVLGTPADPFSMTLNTWDGTFTLVAVQGEQFSLRGSDNWLCPKAMNYGWAGATGGRYLVRFSNLSKSTCANWYLTARGGQRAILVEGPSSQQGGLSLNNFVVEGQNAGDPAMGALVVVKGGGVTLRDLCLNFGMARPSDYTDQADTASVMVQGGVVVVDTVWTCRANVPGSNPATPLSEAVPVVAVTGGVASVDHIFGMGGAWSGKPRVRHTGGTLYPDATVTVVTS